MKKAISLFLTVIILVTAILLPASADTVVSYREQIIDYIESANQQIGIQMNQDDIETMATTIDLAAEKYCLERGLSKQEAYQAIYRELLNESPGSNVPSACSTETVTLPTAVKGYIFFIDSGSAWNHVGLYTASDHIVEAMPEDGVQYWAYNDSGASQSVVTNPADGVNDSCILNVSVSTSKKNAAAEWPGNNVPEGTPYDYDFVDNKSDYYLVNVGTTDSPVYEQYSEGNAYNCSELVWKAYKKAAGIDLDRNGGLGVYPNNILDSSYTSVYKGNWW